VTGRARTGREGIGFNQVDELAGDARPHAASVYRALPVRELHGMAGPAGLRLK
jgi:hypothetical protein